MRIEKADSVTDALVAAMARLVPQLSSSNPAPTAAQLDEMISSPAITLLVAYTDAGEIVGALTLAMFRIPTALRAWIEDVIVDGSQRGQGIGEALTRRRARGCEGGRRDDRRPDLAAVARSGKPPLPAHRVRAPRDERLPVQSELTASVADRCDGQGEEAGR